MIHNGVIILGNGGSGTSLLRGLLNAHPDANILFEYGRALHLSPEEELRNWVLNKEASSENQLWGNKVPIEQFITRKWTDTNILEIINYFRVIWIFRRFSKYNKSNTGDLKQVYKKNWLWGQSLYWRMRECRPDSVMQISFEDLLLRPKIELYRLCDFLGIIYTSVILKGTMDTGYKKYDQAGFDIAKV